jgi:hypothetical protein
MICPSRTCNVTRLRFCTPDVNRGKASGSESKICAEEEEEVEEEEEEEVEEEGLLIFSRIKNLKTPDKKDNISKLLNRVLLK